MSVLLCATLGPVWADDDPGIKDRLTNAGFTPSIVYDGDAAANVSGGARRGTSWSESLHIQLTLDGDKIAGVPGLTGWLDGLWLNGGSPSTFVGDAQGVLNIAGSPALRLYEAWLQYNTPQNRFSFLAGRYDLSTEFYHLRSASLFLNSSFGIGPEFGLSGIGGPSIFPNTSLGIRFAYKPVPTAVVRIAVLDGVPVDPVPGAHGPFDPHNGLLLVAEADFVTHDATNAPPFSSRFRVGRQGNQPPYDDKITVGGWYYTATFNVLPPRHNGEGGAYLLVDHLLFQSTNDPKWRLSGFVQLGIADQQEDRFGSYIGAGLTASGVIPGRPDDELGLAAAIARNASRYIEVQQQAGVPVNGGETSIELSYLAQATAWLAVQPDIQYVINPNTDPRLHNAVIAQVRFEMKF